jgi:signal transduction histidine kinase
MHEDREDLRGSWWLPVFGGVLVVLVVASAAQSDPRPSLGGRGLAVLALLVVFVGAMLWGVVRRSQLVGRPRSAHNLLGVVAASALALTVLQPDGAGYLALYMTLGMVCVRLEPPAAIAGFLGGVVAISALHALNGGSRSLSDIAISDSSGILFFLMGYSARFWRIRQQRAEALVAELQASREAQAQAIALRERARLAREMHDVLAHSLSALTVQLEGARLLARHRDADPALADAIERSHHLARTGLEEARRAIEALRGGDMPGPDRLPALAEAFREQTHVDCSLQLDGTPRELPSEARLALYRTAQEALTNVRRHAHPERVDVRLRYGDDGTWLVVEDRAAPETHVNGHAPSENGLGYGLTGMRERAELLGGRLDAGPTPTGFRVELFLPG